MKSYSKNLLWHEDCPPFTGVDNTYTKIFKDNSFTTQVQIKHDHNYRCYVNEVYNGEFYSLESAKNALDERLDFNINLHYQLKAEHTTTEDILYNLAVEFGYGHYSTREPFEIDYKFWDDVGAERIATALAKKLATALS